MFKRKKILSVVLSLLLVLSFSSTSLAADDKDKSSLVPNFEKGQKLDPETGIVQPMASGTHPGAYTSDYSYFPTSNAPSSHLNKGLCYINSKVETTDWLSDLFYVTFSGYGSTQWQGSGTAKSTFAKVTVKSSGILPYISINGGKWDILSTSPVQVATQTSTNNNLAKANYSNVKVRSLGTFTIIFETTSKIVIDSSTSYNSSEDVWWWS